MTRRQTVAPYYTTIQNIRYENIIILFHLIILFRFVVCSDNRRWTCDLSSATEKSRATPYFYRDEHVFSTNINIIQCRPRYNRLWRSNYFNNALVKLSLLEHNEEPFLFIFCVCVSKYNIHVMYIDLNFTRDSSKYFVVFSVSISFAFYVREVGWWSQYSIVIRYEAPM